jgi:hypothetical protein
VVLAVAGTYLQTIATAARIESQRAQVANAQAIYNQAEVRKTAGTNARIDVMRTLVELPGGFVLMLMMPIAGRITATKIDPRLLISIGFLGTAFSLYRMTIISLQIDFHTIVLLRMAQVGGR